jgi:hypothetical protein
MARVKLNSQLTASGLAIPASVLEAQTIYKKGRSHLWRKAYLGQIKERTKSMIKDFKVKKAIGIVFTILGVRVVSDYLKSRRALRSKLTLIGQTLSIELARDPALREAIKILVKSYPYLSVNKKGEIYLSSFSGSIIDKSSVYGDLFNPENLNPQAGESYKAKKAFGQKLSLKSLLSVGNPKFEKAIGTSTIAGSPATAPINVTTAIMGNNELRIFSRTTTGGVIKSEERVINSRQVKSKRLVASSAAGKKILLVEVEETGKPIEVIRLELDAKKADSMFKGFNIRK